MGAWSLIYIENNWGTVGLHWQIYFVLSVIAIAIVGLILLIVIFLKIMIWIGEKVEKW